MEKLTPIEQATRTLKSYPTAKEVYFTSDGQCFINANHRDLHIKTLDDKKFTTVTRDQVEAEIKKEAKVVKLKEADLNYKKMNKAALLAEVAKRTPAITLDPDATNADIIALLEQDDANQPA